MGKHIVFLVHGMGTYVRQNGELNNSWHEYAKACMKACYEQYEEFTGASTFEEAYEIVEINYDTIFNSVLRDWRDLAEEINAFAPNDAIRFLSDVFERGGSVEDNFLWTHFGDVLFYRFAPTVRHYVQVAVADQIARKLRAEQAASNRQFWQSRQWSIVAHSLGTRVVHDTLSNVAAHMVRMNADGNWPEPSVVAMISNVSRVIELRANGLPSAYAANLRPGVNCFHYLSVCHRFDPFTVLDPFRPGGSSQWRNLRSRRGDYVELNDLRHLPIPEMSNDDGELRSVITKALVDFVPHHFTTLFNHPMVHLHFFHKTLVDIPPTFNFAAWRQQAADAYEAGLNSGWTRSVQEGLEAKLQQWIETAISRPSNGDALLKAYRLFVQSMEG
ncbi:MAG: hypothetical protein ACK4NO_05300 [Glycocaulis sp.]